MAAIVNQPVYPTSASFVGYNPYPYGGFYTGAATAAPAYSGVGIAAAAPAYSGVGIAAAPPAYSGFGIAAAAPAYSGVGIAPAAPSVGLANYAAPFNGYYYGGYPAYQSYRTYPTYTNYRYRVPVVNYAPAAPIAAPVTTSIAASVAPAPVGNLLAAPVAQAPLQLDQATLAEIETRVAQFLTRRQPVLRRQIIKVPGAPGRLQQIVRRLPTPPPDVVENVYVVEQQRDLVNVLIERPATPPPQVQERRVIGRAHKPVVSQQVVRVAPRVQYAQQEISYNYAPAQPAAPAVVNYQASSDQLAGYGVGYAAAPAYTAAAYQPVAYSSYQAAPVDANSSYGYSYGYPYTYAAPAVAPTVAATTGVQPSASGVAGYGYSYGYPSYGYPSYGYGYPGYGYPTTAVSGQGIYPAFQ